MQVPGRSFIVISCLILSAGCSPDDGPEAPVGDRTAFPAIPEFSVPVRVTEHRGDDDLVSAGLGLEGLAAAAPMPLDPESPTAAELRRLAIHVNWNGIGPLSPAGGLGGLLDSLPRVPGREYHAFLTLDGARHPFRVAVQLPDDFDLDKPCLVVAPASGSRGVYGAIAVAAPWALPRGCAVTYHDKAAGTDFFDFSDHTATNLTGQRVPFETEAVGFAPDVPDEFFDQVGMRHAHSGDLPEADWGRHTLAAIEFGLEVLSVAFERAFDAGNTRVIAAAVSNGGNAVLRAAEIDRGGLIDAVVSVMPNISPPGQPRLYEYATLAALYQPCLLADAAFLQELPLGSVQLASAGQQRCNSLAQDGMLDSADAMAARQVLVEAGFDDAALSQSAVNVVLDFWRSVAVSYAASYLRRGPFHMPCGYSLQATAATPAQRQAWWGSHSGIAPGNGIEIVDSLAEGADPSFAGLKCLHELATGQGEKSDALRAGLEGITTTAELADIPVLVIHGRDDGLIPVVFSSRPYVEAARANGADIAYWEIEHAQHFDALLAAPGVAGRYVPILPYGWAGMDRIMAVLDGLESLGEDRHIVPTPAAPGESLEQAALGL